jgi:hypothetical protein
MRGRSRQARLTNHLTPAQLVKRNRQVLRPVRRIGETGSEVCIYPGQCPRHIACLDDTRKGVGQPVVACFGPSSADRTAVTMSLLTVPSLCRRINIETQQGVGWTPMPLHFIFGQPKRRVLRFLHNRMPPPTASTHQPSIHFRLTTRFFSSSQTTQFAQTRQNATSQHCARVRRAANTPPFGKRSRPIGVAVFAAQPSPIPGPR